MRNVAICLCSSALHVGILGKSISPIVARLHRSEHFRAHACAIVDEHDYDDNEQTGAKKEDNAGVSKISHRNEIAGENET